MKESVPSDIGKVQGRITKLHKLVNGRFKTRLMANGIVRYHMESVRLRRWEGSIVQCPRKHSCSSQTRDIEPRTKNSRSRHIHSTSTFLSTTNLQDPKCISISKLLILRTTTPTTWSNSETAQLSSSKTICLLEGLRRRRKQREKPRKAATGSRIMILKKISWTKRRSKWQVRMLKLETTEAA